MSFFFRKLCKRSRVYFILKFNIFLLFRYILWWILTLLTLFLFFLRFSYNFLRTMKLNQWSLINNIFYLNTIDLQRVLHFFHLFLVSIKFLVFNLCFGGFVQFWTTKEHSCLGSNFFSILFLWVLWWLNWRRVNIRCFLRLLIILVGWRILRKTMTNFSQYVLLQNKRVD